MFGVLVARLVWLPHDNVSAVSEEKQLLGPKYTTRKNNARERLTKVIKWGLHWYGVTRFFLALISIVDICYGPLLRETKLLVYQW